MRIIGITGGIGAGKSTVLSVLDKDYQAYILEADKAAHHLMEPGQPVYRQILSAFPEIVPDATGRIDRNRLSALVFQQPARLEQLNRIVHPAVKSYILDQISICRSAETVEYFVIEAALLIEDGYTAICDEIWYIYAPDTIRIERLMQSRGYSREKCEQIMRNQASDSFYRSHSTRIIENQRSVSDIKKQIQELLKIT